MTLSKLLADIRKHPYFNTFVEDLEGPLAKVDQGDSLLADERFSFFYTVYSSRYCFSINVENSVRTITITSTLDEERCVFNTVVKGVSCNGENFSFSAEEVLSALKD